LTLFLNVFSLQGKDASKLAGNWFQHVMVIFTKESIPTSVLCVLYYIQLCNKVHFVEYETEIILRVVKCCNCCCCCCCLNIQN
jgi:hypothetical protein